MLHASRLVRRSAKRRWPGLRHVRWHRPVAADPGVIRTRVAASVIVGLNLLAAGVVVGDLAGLDAPDPIPALPLWLAVAAFSLAELAVVRLEIAGQPVVLALRATPLLAGLTYLAPAEVVAAHVLGTSLALLARNRLSTSRAAIVLASNGLGTALAAVAFTALLPGWSGTAAGWWLAGSAALVVATLAWTVGSVVHWSPPRQARPFLSFGTALTYGSIASVVDASLAVAVVIFLRTDPSELLLLAGPAALLLAAYRAWAGLRRRQARVEYLYACARLLDGPSSGAAMFDELLGLTRDIVGADRAELLLDETGGRCLSAGVGPGETRRLLAEVPGDALLGVRARLGPHTGAVVVRHRTEGSGGSPSVGLVHAMVVRIGSENGVSGTLVVAGRADGVPFSRDDLRLIESVAVNLGSTLGGRRMAEELRASLGDLAQLAALTIAAGEPEASPGLDVAVPTARPWLMATGSSAAIGVVDAGFTWQWVNDALCRLLGTEAHELVGRRFELLVTRDDIEAAHGLVSRMLRGESRGSSVEIRLRRPDTCDPVVVSFFVRPLASGDPGSRALCMFEDLTAIRAAEERAARIERLAQTAVLRLTAIREPAVVLDVLIDAAREVTGADVVAVQGETGRDMVLAPGGDGGPEALRLTTGHHSLSVPIPGAGEVSLLLQRRGPAAPFTPAEEAVVRRLTEQAGASLDNAFAHQRSMELVRQLDAANASLQLASAARAQFLANVSHELRTPLHGILITAQMLADPAVAARDPERARALPATIERTGRHLLDLIEDLVDLSRIDLQELRMDLVPMNLRVAADDAAGQVGPLADERGVELAIDAGGDILVRGDPRRLRQVLVNLLANAVKYTPRDGRVRLRVERDPDGVHMSVLDTGIGIEPADVARAFDPFERLAGTGVPGAGLGLPIARRIMELHGGCLTATSLPGLGSVFTAHLPMSAILQPAPAATDSLPAPRGRRPATRRRAIA